MTLQMLPIAQIGAMLSTNQWTEELPHNTADTSKSDTGSQHAPFLPPLNHHSISTVAESKALAYLHISDTIPSNHSTDIVTPPPDFTV
jgi:hypothetical protein